MTNIEIVKTIKALRKVVYGYSPNIDTTELKKEAEKKLKELIKKIV